MLDTPEIFTKTEKERSNRRDFLKSISSLAFGVTASMHDTLLHAEQQSETRTSSVHFLPDGRLASIDSKGKVRIPLEEGELDREYLLPVDVNLIRVGPIWSSNGKHIIVHTKSSKPPGEIRLIDTTNGKLTNTFFLREITDRTGSIGEVRNLHFSPTNDRIAVVCEKRLITFQQVDGVLSLQQEDFIKELEFSEKASHFSPDGSKIALAIAFSRFSKPERVEIHDSNTLALTEEFTPFENGRERIRALAFTPDAKQLLVGTNEKVRSCNLETAEVTDVFNVAEDPGRRYQINHLHSTPDGKYICVLGVTVNENFGDVRHFVEVRDVKGSLQQRQEIDVDSYDSLITFHPHESKMAISGDAQPIIINYEVTN